MAKLIDRYYKSQTNQRVEEYLIDTDAELKDLPKAPAGSFAISVESGKNFITTLTVNGRRILANTQAPARLRQMISSRNTWHGLLRNLRARPRTRYATACLETVKN